MHKEFPSSRICVIDYYPLLKSAVKETVHICKKYNIPFITSGRQSKDVHKFFYHYCLDKFCSEYKKCSSKHEKVLVFYPIPRELPFSEKSLDKILAVLPVPYCKVSSWYSPDLESAASRALVSSKNTHKTTKFASKHDLFNVLKGLQKNTIFSKGTVDFSMDIE